MGLVTNTLILGKKERKRKEKNRRKKKKKRKEMIEKNKAEVKLKGQVLLSRQSLVQQMNSNLLFFFFFFWPGISYHRYNFGFLIGRICNLILNTKKEEHILCREDG